MYIDSLTVSAFIVFAIAMVMFVKKCVIGGCIISADNKTVIPHDDKPGDEQ